MTAIRALWASDPDDRREWISTLLKNPDSQPACFPSYLEMFAAGDNRPVLLVYSDGEHQAVMPLVIRSIPDVAVPPNHDAQGAYGYSTAMWVSESPGASDDFWAAVKDWARAHDLVSVVTRLPVAGEWIPWAFDTHGVGSNVVRSLIPPEQLWTDVEHKVRKNVKRARSAGVTVEVGRPDEFAAEFHQVYLSTMRRRQATATFHSSNAQLERLYAELDARARIAVAFLDGEAISVELLLIGGKTMLSFLGGTLESAFQYRPNDLLKFEVMVWAFELGLTEYVLGGGPGGQDGIFRYKKSFAPTGVVDFCIGELRANSGRYEELVSQHGAGDTFPRYR